jgi:regulator of cell morphogenesis and NO signaling
MQEPTMPTIRPDDTLADLATHWAFASRVFQRLDLDFCCQGHRTLADACRDRRLPVDDVLAELRTELSPAEGDDDWSQRPSAALIAHLVDHFHRDHRAELPRLIAMAQKVEQVHADKADCPRGLADQLSGIATRLELHMQKEEQILFPLLLTADTDRTRAPIECLTAEHDEHGRDLTRLRQLAHGYEPPACACGTWRALYLGLHEFERAVMEHIHLENHVLFPRGAQHSGR